MQGKKELKFVCEECGAKFTTKKQLGCHIGGSHRKGAVLNPTCFVCGEKLIKDVNWKAWAYTKSSYICKSCKNIVNKQNTKLRKEKEMQKEEQK